MVEGESGGPGELGELLLSTVVYGTGGGRPLTLHLLRPAGQPPAGKPLPALIFVHGGGWRGGDKDEGITRLLPFARRGYVCASVGYRLSGEAIFPAQIEDCKCAVRFLRANAARYGIDPARIGAWGPSAGGHLVALLGTAPDVPELEGEGGSSEQSSRVQAVCDWFGPTDLLQMSAHPSTLDHDAPDSSEALLLGGPIQEHPERAARANPITYLRGGEPPFLIQHGDEDQLVPHHQSILLYEALMRAGDEVTFQTLLGADHGGPAFEHPATQRLVTEFFDRHLRPGAPPDSPDGRSGEAPAATSVAAKAWVAPETAPAGTVYRTFESRAAGGPVGYALYLPPDYDAAPARRYPVVYWLHGLGGDPSRGATFVKMLDEAIRQGIAPPAVAVLVNGLRNSMYCDSADGRWPVERVLIQDLLPHVDATYRTVPAREARCIEGQSMGGYGAARLGFGYPDLFGAVSISAGALHTAATLVERRSAILRSVFGGDRAYAEACSPWTAVERNAGRIKGRTAVRLFVGDQDGLLAANERFHDLLDRLEIAHEYTVVPGAAHSYDDKVSRLGLGHFGFFARAFGALSAPVTG